jgi:DNA modification methylase
MLPAWWPSDKPFLVGDVRDKLAVIPDGVIQCIVTSPPYFGLRSYLPDTLKLKQNVPGSILKELEERHIYPFNHIGVEK